MDKRLIRNGDSTRKLSLKQFVITLFFSLLVLSGIACSQSIVFTDDEAIVGADLIYSDPEDDEFLDLITVEKKILVKTLRSKGSRWYPGRESEMEYIPYYHFIIINVSEEIEPESMESYIDGDWQITNDTNILMKNWYMKKGPGWVDNYFTFKSYNGSVDVMYLFNTLDGKPTKARLEHPHNVTWNTSHSADFLNVSSIVPISDACLYGNEYNTYKRTITYDNYWSNTSGFSTVVCFDSYIQNGSDYRIFWHTRHIEEKQWINIADKFISAEIENGSLLYNLTGMNLRYTAKDVNIIQDKEYHVQFYLDLTWDEEVWGYREGKYWVATKPSPETVRDAIQNDHFYYQDPGWYNVSYEYCYRGTADFTDVAYPNHVRQLLNVDVFSFNGTNTNALAFLVNITGTLTEEEWEWWFEINNTGGVRYRRTDEMIRAEFTLESDITSVDYWICTTDDGGIAGKNSSLVHWYLGFEQGVTLDGQGWEVEDGSITMSMSNLAFNGDYSLNTTSNCYTEKIHIGTPADGAQVVVTLAVMQRGGGGTNHHYIPIAPAGRLTGLYPYHNADGPTMKHYYGSAWRTSLTDAPNLDEWYIHKYEMNLEGGEVVAVWYVNDTLINKTITSREPGMEEIQYMMVSTCDAGSVVLWDEMYIGVDGKNFSIYPVIPTITWKEYLPAPELCEANSDCDAGEYCDSEQACQDDLDTGYECGDDITYLDTDAENNGACVSAYCRTTIGGTDNDKYCADSSTDCVDYDAGETANSRDTTYQACEETDFDYVCTDGDWSGANACPDEGCTDYTYTADSTCVESSGCSSPSPAACSDFFNCVGAICNTDSTDQTNCRDTDYYCNIGGDACVADANLGGNCVGVAYSGTNDEVCDKTGSAVCDDDGVGETDDDWCFVPSDTHFDGQEDTKCEYSTGEIITELSDEYAILTDLDDCDEIGEVYYEDEISPDCELQDITTVFECTDSDCVCGDNECDNIAPQGTIDYCDKNGQTYFQDDCGTTGTAEDTDATCRESEDLQVGDGCTASAGTGGKVDGDDLNKCDYTGEDYYEDEVSATCGYEDITSVFECTDTNCVCGDNECDGIASQGTIDYCDKGGETYFRDDCGTTGTAEDTDSVCREDEDLAVGDGCTASAGTSGLTANTDLDKCDYTGEAYFEDEVSSSCGYQDITSVFECGETGCSCGDAECDGIAPDATIDYCDKGGESYFQDDCGADSTAVDYDNTCLASESLQVGDGCTADAECDGETAGTGQCSAACEYTPPSPPYTNISSCTVINTGGRYKFNQTIYMDVNRCIDLNTTDIFLDCDNYYITNRSTGTAFHIYFGTGTNSNITLLNCKVNDTTYALDALWADNLNVTNFVSFSAGTYALKTYYCDSSTYKNITIDGDGDATRGWWYYDDTGHSSIEDVFVTDTTYAGLYFYNSPNVDVTNAQLNSTGTYGIYIRYPWSSGANNQILTNIAQYNAQYGFYITDASGVTITASKFWSNSKYDVYVSPGIATHTGNTFTDVDVTDSEGGDTGRFYYTEDDDVDIINENYNLVILNNAHRAEISNLTISNYPGEKNNGLVIQGSNSVNISSSFFTNVYNGIYFHKIDSINCSIYNNNFTGDFSNEYNAIYLYSNIGVKVYNNTFNCSPCKPLFIQGDLVEIYNNHFVCGAKFCIYFLSDADSLIYNNIFDLATGPSYFSWAGVHNLNTSLQNGTRILGNGTLVGGNAWLNESGGNYYDCPDSDKDGICNNAFDATRGGDYDYLPLSDEYSLEVGVAGLNYTLSVGVLRFQNCSPDWEHYPSAPINQTDPEWNYQEDANSTTCVDNLCDGDWDTTGAKAQMNYTKPFGVSSSIWQVKDSAGIANLTIPQDCWDYDVNKLILQIAGAIPDVWQCYDGNWISLRTGTPPSYEEAMWWGTSNSILQLCNNGTVSGTIKANYTTTPQTGWTLYIGNQSGISNAIELTATPTNLYGSLAAGSCIDVWLYANCSSVTISPRTEYYLIIE